MSADTWEARKAARARERAYQQEPHAVQPQQTTGPCAHCGYQKVHRGQPERLRYWNMKTLANYCSEACLRHDPAWDDNAVWMA